jgi:hypothetical protein
METLVTSLILASVSALGLLAYKHPNGYQKVGLVLMLLIGAVGLQSILFNYNELRGATRFLQKYLEENPEKPLHFVSYSISTAYGAVQTISWAALIVLASEVYLLLLWWLPAITGHKPEENLAPDVQDATKRLLEVLERIEHYNKPVEPRPEKEEDKTPR